MATSLSSSASPTGGLKFGKHLQLTHAQTTIIITAAIGIFVVVFTIFAAKSLISQRAYQAKVISMQKVALAQLQFNQAAAKALVKSYDNFEGQATNALGGTANGTGAQDGDNATLVMQALPASYDFPALASSLEKIITSQSMSIQSISGQDQQVTEGANTSGSNPQPVDMPFSISAQGTYAQVQALIGVFEHSIRPFQIQSIELRGDQSNMTVNITAQTYYQPAKNFNILEKAVN